MDGDVSLWRCLYLVEKTYLTPRLQVKTHPYPLPAIRFGTCRLGKGMGDELLVVCDAKGIERAIDGEESSALKT